MIISGKFVSKPRNAACIDALTSAYFTRQSQQLKTLVLELRTIIVLVGYSKVRKAKSLLNETKHRLIGQYCFYSTFLYANFEFLVFVSRCVTGKEK